MEVMANIINVGNAPTNIDVLESNQKKITSDKKTLAENNLSIKQLVEKLKEAIDEIDVELNKFDLVKLKTNTNYYDALNRDLQKIQNDIDKKNVELISKGSILSSFGSNMDYDPHCVFCVKANKKHADHIKKTGDEFSNIQMEIGALTLRKDDLINGINLASDVVEKNQKVN
jgi:hypothetical protein